ncbi:hypothetical protein BV372_11710 [Nostoc sp. T09]|uniref:hypothetical protein n=1 Tax=Nostoc sp. T09 TaxID=1932621 RepID=UPI000B6BF5DA|nr:hypothetical protein [Nostoc sp. T09]OUL35188.1 hypothetical protein BV372_11710 [Nostoc sp. T09]
MALRQKTSWLLRGMKNFIIILVRFVSASINYIRQSFSHLKKYLAGKKLVIFVLFLLITCGLISLAALLPSTHIFEGNLIVEEMSFTYDDRQPKLFLQSIRHISSLESEGIQSLTFTGKFTSASSPQLNQLNTLKVELTDSKSRLIITPANSKETSEIDLNELRLQPNTKVMGLSYDFYRRRLAFSLQPQPTPELGNQPNSLQIYLGEQPLKIILEGYKLPGTNLPKNPDEQAPLEFNLNPDNKELNLKINQDNTIYLTTSKLPEDNDVQWFRGKIATKDVKFQRLERSGDIRDDLAISTIVEGKVRMAEQEREIKQNQFLMSEKPDVPLNIELIRHLQIVPKKGLEVRFAGKTQQLKIGLDKDFPVSTIQGSRLDGILPRDAIIAIFSFAAGTITLLLSYLIEKASNSKSK